MLACILNSPIAIEMNIRIIRLLTKMREAISTNKEIQLKLELIEQKLDEHDENIHALFHVIKQLVQRDEIRQRTGQIGFKKERN